jgi:hypothetical protein
MIAAFAAALLLADVPPAVVAPLAATAPALPLAGAFVKPGAMLDAAARAALPRASVDVTDPDSRSAHYAGVTLASVLAAAGAPVGDAVRGAAARAYVVVGAADHYSAIYTLAELRSSAAACAPLVADERNGAPLDAKTGPLHLVAPCDLTHARWVRNVTSLTIVVAPAEPGAPAAAPGH